MRRGAARAYAAVSMQQHQYSQQQAVVDYSSGTVKLPQLGCTLYMQCEPLQRSIVLLGIAVDHNIFKVSRDTEYWKAVATFSLPLRKSIDTRLQHYGCRRTTRRAGNGARHNGAASGDVSRVPTKCTTLDAARTNPATPQGWSETAPRAAISAAG